MAYYATSPDALAGDPIPENRVWGAFADSAVYANDANDANGRRIAKTRLIGSDAESTLFVYDGWNVIQEWQNSAVSSAASAATGLELHAYLVWGEDLSGSLQGAGGVGGLLLRAASDGIAYFHYDANGNPARVANGNGGWQGRYRYDAFGNVRNIAGTLAENNPWRFSTKYSDEETGLSYYGYRYYDPVTGRWPSRDPIAERGGVNLYGFVFNNPIFWFDYLGKNPTPVDVGSSVPNGPPSGNNLFDRVAGDDGERVVSGKEMLEQLVEESKNNCCVKTWTIAGHGWASADSTPGDGDNDHLANGNGRGSGVPGVANGSGLYSAGTGGVNRAAGGATLTDLAQLMSAVSEGIKFCEPCTIQIHSCRISAEFTQQLAQTTGCKVISAASSCKPNDRNPNDWDSVPGNWAEREDQGGGNSGFQQSDGGAPVSPIGTTYRPQ